MRSQAQTVEGYLGELPEERRQVVAAVREVVLANLPAGYRETVNWGMITYELPLETYPDTYNGQPLSYLALAAQKSHYAIYLTCANQDPAETRRLEEAFARAGKKLDMGKSCVRFKKLDDLPLDVIAASVARFPPAAFIASYEAGRQAAGPAPAKSGAKAKAPARAKAEG